MPHYRKMTQEQVTDILKELSEVGFINPKLQGKLLQLASEAIALSTLQTMMANLPASAAKKPIKDDKSTSKSFKLNKKELNEIPEMYRKIFACKDKIISYRYHKGVYEAHYRGNGMDVYASSKDFTEMKRKFIAKLNALSEQGVEPTFPRKKGEEPVTPQKPKRILFYDYVNEWLEIKKRTTKSSSYKEYERLCRYNLIKAFDGKYIDEITRPDIQKYLFSIVDEGKHRTAEKLQQIMTCIFDIICDDLNITSPMKKITLPYYEAKKGSALTKEEEKRLVDFCIQNIESAASSALLILLYFGLRKSELATISIEGEELTCITSKTRLGKGEVRRTIPFTPVFKRVLGYVDFDKAKATNVHTIDSTMKRLFPSRHTHELRYTFITRAKECGVSGEVVMLWDGHTYDRDVKTSLIDRGYTTYSREFILKEAEKVDYELI